MRFPITITEPGYVYIYLSNEQASLQAGQPIDVFFDDFTVTHTHSEVVQKDDYYPFGMSFNSYTREAMTDQNYLFNGGSEKEEMTGWYMTPFRKYDPTIGRFHGVDALADMYPTMTPSHFAMNNPIMFNDPTGLHVAPDVQDHDMGAWSGGNTTASESFHHTTTAGHVGQSSGNSWTNSIAGINSNAAHMSQSTFNNYYNVNDGTRNDLAQQAATVIYTAPEESETETQEENGENDSIFPSKEEILADATASVEPGKDYKRSRNDEAMVKAMETLMATVETLGYMMAFEIGAELLLFKVGQMVIAARMGIQLSKSVSSEMGASYRAVGEVTSQIKNTELLSALNKASKGNWNKVYEAAIHNGNKIEVHYFRNSTTGKVFDVKTKYNYWHQKVFKNL